MGWERKRGKLHELNLLLTRRKEFIFHYPEQHHGFIKKGLRACAFRDHP